MKKAKQKKQIEHNKLVSIVYKNINDLQPYEKNPRKISEDAILKVKKSITSFGMKNPIIIDKNNVIIAGHTRLKALQMLQLENEVAIDFTKIPCIIADDLTKDEAKAFRIADNKVAEFSLWDDEMLELECTEIEGFDMSAFGVDLSQLESSNLDKEQETVENNVEHKKVIICPMCGCEIEEK